MASCASRGAVPRAALAALLLATLGGATLARAAPPLPPGALLQRALEADPEIRAAEARRREAEAAARLTVLGPHEWTLSADAARRRVAGEGSFDEWETALQRGLRLPGKAALDRELARLEVAQSEAALDAARRRAQVAILEDWFACVRAAQRARLAEADAADTARIAAAMLARRRAGDAARLDAALADAEAASGGAEAGSARSAALAAARVLATRVEGASCELDAWDEPAAAAPPAAGARDALDPSVAPYQLAAERARRAAERARRDRWPDPTLGVRYATEFGGAEKVGGLSISVPLAAGRRGAEAARARASAEVAGAELDAVRAGAARERVVLEAELARARAAWSRLAEAATLQAEAARLANRAFELGELPLSDALLQRRSALRARLAEREAALDAWRAAALHEARYGTSGVPATGAPGG